MHSVSGSTRVEALRSWVSDGRGCGETNVHDHVLAYADPPHPPSEESLKVHTPYRVSSNITSHRMPHPQVVPNRLANHVVLPKILSKRR